MKKIIVLSVLLSCVAGCFGTTIEFDSDGLIVNGYGNRRFTDGQTVSFDYFQEIRIFSAIQLDNWNIVRQELDAGIGIDWKVKVNLELDNDIAQLEYTLLQFAIINGKEEIARKLIERGAKLFGLFVDKINGNTQASTLDRLVFTNTFITKQLSSDFLLFFLDNISGMEFSSDTYAQAGIYSNSAICLKMIEKHLNMIDFVTTNEDISETREEWIQRALLSDSGVPFMIMGAILSNKNKNNQTTISADSMDVILNIMQSPFGKQYAKEISNQFKQKIMPLSDKTFGNEESYRYVRQFLLSYGD